MTVNRAAKNLIREVQRANKLPYAAAACLVDVFDQVLKHEPTLTGHGFGLHDEHRLDPEQHRTQLAAERDVLRCSLPTVIRIHEWLRANVQPIKTPDKSSFATKHTAKRAMGEYITNGQFIAAALMAGYPMGPVK